MDVLLLGARLGPYEILAPLGAGGMGEVYRARDSRLDRLVAVKVLGAGLNGDPTSRDRFEREARSIAALSHPHICTLHDVGNHQGHAFLVMELLEGQTVAARLGRAKGGLPVAEALSIATAVAEALAFAHRHHVVHRDIKPANIMITPAGVKLLDFGLARLRDRDDVSGQSRTQSSLTEPHHVMGTLAYMSPEQLDGRADERSDVFGFGVVLFEMLTGRKAFAGDTSSAVIAGIVHTEPPAVSSLRPDVSPALDRAVRRCLAKDPDSRWHSAADLADELKWIAGHPVPGGAAIESSPRRVRALPVLVAGLAAALLAVVIAWAPWRPTAIQPSPSETRTEIVTSATVDSDSFALSPDGRQIVFVAESEGTSRLWLRSLATTMAQPLAGTEGATSPFWSPDSGSVGFFAANALKRLDLGGGAPQTLAPVSVRRGGTWNADGVIVFGPNTVGPLMRVSATGGDAAVATTLGPQQIGHLWPHALPNGRQFLFYVQGTDAASGIYLGATDGSAPARLVPSDSAGVFLPDRARSTESRGWLLWIRSGSLVAQRLAVEQAKLLGEPIAVAEGVAVDRRYRAAISVAAAGSIAYRPDAGQLRQLTWVDRSGTARGTVGNPDANNLGNPRLSPDGRRVVVTRTVQGNSDLWLLDGAVASRFTFDAARDGGPVWSPDGTRIVFRSNREGGFYDLYQKPSSGGGVEERIVTSDQHKAAVSWSPDGRFLMYPSFDSQTDNDLWVVPMLGDRTPAVFLKTPGSEAFATFSPDGKWVAYDSNESGRMQIYIRRFVPPGSKRPAGGLWQVSVSGGMYPAWRPDGKELYYIDSSGAMMAVPIVVTGSTLEPGAPIRLFPTRIVGGGGTEDSSTGRHYDVARDGRFLINTALDDAAAPITLVMNWRPPTP